MPETWQNLTLLMITMMGIGVLTFLGFTLTQKGSILLTWMWMIFFAIVSGIVMLVLFVTPTQRKKQSRTTMD